MISVVQKQKLKPEYLLNVRLSQNAESRYSPSGHSDHMLMLCMVGLNRTFLVAA